MSSKAKNSNDEPLVAVHPIFKFEMDPSSGPVIYIPESEVVDHEY